MWASGFVDEVAGLIPQGLRQGPTASKAIGYRQALDFIDGLMTRDEAMESQWIRTRQFSRKQLSWWRRDPRVVWLDARRPPIELVSRLLSDPADGCPGPLWSTLGSVVDPVDWEGQPLPQPGL